MYYSESSLEKSAGEKINKISSRHMVGLLLLKVSSISSTSSSSAAPGTQSSTTLLTTATFEHGTGDLYELFFDRVSGREDD